MRFGFAFGIVMTVAVLAAWVRFSGRRSWPPCLRQPRASDLVGRLNIGVAIFDGEGRLLDANSAFAGFTGHENASDMVGRRGHEWLDPAMHKRFDAFLGLEPAGPQRTNEASYVLRDGARRVVEVQYEAFKQRGKKRIVVACRDIAQEKDGATQMRLLKRALDTSHDGIALSRLVGRENRFVYVNTAFEQLFGYSAEEIIDQSPRILFEESSDNQAEFSKIQEEVLRERPMEHRHLARRKDGSKFLRQISITPFRDIESGDSYAVSIHKDVTEGAALARRLELKRRAIQASQSGIAIATFVDGSPTIVFANKAISKITGYGIDELHGRSPDFLLAGCDASHGALAFRELASTPRSIHTTYESRRRDGTPYWSEIFVDPVADDSGSIAHCIVMVNDVTERKKIEERLNLSQRVEALGQLTGGVAHDFNNLLTVIISSIRLMQQPGADPAAQENRLKLALEAAKRGANFTQRLLAFARRQVLRSEVHSINDIVCDMVPLLNRTLGETIQVQTALDPGILNCRLDRAQLEGALINLAINARDAMPNRGRLIITTAEQVVDGSGSLPLKPGRYAKVTVTDTGCGMPREVRERAFEPFFTTKDVGQGTGLGLSSVLGFVQQSGGHAHINSEPGRGTSVKIYLPRTEEQVLNVVKSAGALMRSRGRGQKILVVEDDELVWAATASLLTKTNYSPIQAGDATEALGILERGDDISLVFSDVVMPGGISGIDLFRTLKKMSPGLPVLLASGYPREALHDLAGISDQPDFLPKPYEPNDLLAKIDKLLTSAHDADGAADRTAAGRPEAPPKPCRNADPGEYPVQTRQ
ncbi:MAG: PAS domain S-box protein [Rhodospirillaceae bacterium]